MKRDLLTLQRDWRLLSGALHPLLHCCCCATGLCLDWWVGTGPPLAGEAGWMDGCLQVGAGALTVRATYSIILGQHTVDGRIKLELFSSYTPVICMKVFYCCCWYRWVPFCEQIWLKWSRSWLIQVRAPKSTVSLWAHNPLQKNPHIS